MHRDHAYRMGAIVSLLTADPDGVATAWATASHAADPDGIATLLPGAMLAADADGIATTFSGQIADGNALVETLSTSTSAVALADTDLDGTLADGTLGYIDALEARRITVTASSTVGAFVLGSTITITGKDVDGEELIEVLEVTSADGNFTLTTVGYFAAGAGNEITIDIEPQADTDGSWTVGVTGDLLLYQAASFDGAGMSGLAIAGWGARAVSVTSASDTNAYNVTDPIEINGIELLLTSDDGNQTITSTIKLDAGTELRILIPQQLLAAAEFTLGLGQPAEQRFSGADLDGAGVTAGALEGTGTYTPTATTSNTTGAWVVGSKIWFLTASASVYAVLTAANGNETVVANGAIPSGEAVTVAIEGQTLSTGTIDLGFTVAGLDLPVSELDGAEITAGALEGTEPRNLTFTLSNTVGGFVASSVITVTGKNANGQPQTESLTIPGANGSVTLTGTKFWKPGTALAIRIPGQTAVAATINIGVGTARWVGHASWATCVAEDGGVAVVQDPSGALFTWTFTARDEIPSQIVAFHEGTTDVAFAPAYLS